MASPTQVTLLAAAAMLLVGCASSPSQGTLNDVRADANPSDRAQRNTTSFTPALRCMDDIMFRRGTRDITLMMEEMRDATQRVPISARDEASENTRPRATWSSWPRWSWWAA